mmetsp:Transcript_46501/g.129417  ORF Transcript_46501/g.129417 Transcript_46501/m.129417 type:complete len:208 (+) Transcript_46501:1071-1694(+)
MCNFFMGDGLVEIIERILVQASRELVYIGEGRLANAASEEALRTQAMVKLFGGRLACRLAVFCLFHELPQELPDVDAELFVGLVVVRRVPAHPVAWFGERHGRNVGGVQDWFCLHPLQVANLQALVLFEDLVCVVAPESVRCVCASVLQQEQLPARVHGREFRHIVNVSINGHPSVSLQTMPPELLKRNRQRHPFAAWLAGRCQSWA